MQPLVSVVIPCYKGERYLSEALESCLNQTHENLEIIVVDDASPDRCAEIAQAYARKDPRVQVIQLPRNGGVSAAFNAGFERAKGEYMTRIAQDDIFEKTAIAAMVGHLQLHPSAGLVYCDEQRIDESGKVLEQYRKPDPEQVLSEGNKMGLCVMWRRKVWEEIGKFNSRFDTAEDYEYWMRVQRRFELVGLRGTPQLSVRIHAEMGSKVYSGKQEVLAAQIRALYSSKGWVSRRKILQAGYFDAAYNYREHKMQREALRWAISAIYQWPFGLNLYRLLASVLLAIASRGLLGVTRES